MSIESMGENPPLNVSPEIIQQSEQAWKKRALDAEAKLKRYEEREPLVQALLTKCVECPQCDVVDEMCASCERTFQLVRDFKLE